MKEKTVILAVFLIAAMLTMLFASAVKAWEYSDTWIGNPKTDDLWEPFGPRADKIQIQMYPDEGAEFSALQSGLLDMTDSPITSNEYPTWTQPPLNQSIAVVKINDDGYDLCLLDLRCNNDSYIQTFGPNIANPAFNTQYGNPMADVWLRRAIACVNDRPFFSSSPLYTDLASIYGTWVDPSLAPGPPTPANQWIYANVATGGADVARGNAYLNAHGYVYNAGQDCRLSQGGIYKFSIEFIVRSDDWQRRRAAMDPGGVVDLMTKAPPNGLGMKNNLIVTQKTSGGAKADFMDVKKAHMYTAYLSPLNTDPDHLYDTFSKAGYWHPGCPSNYAGYPGNITDDYTVPSNGWIYTGFPADYIWVGSGFNFADPGKTWNAGQVISTNPANYWSREMMTGILLLDWVRAQFCAYKCEEFLAFWACGVPWWGSDVYTAFSRKYSAGGNTGTPEDAYKGHYWEGVVNQKGIGVWGTTSFLNMHTDNAEVGDGSHMVIRQGFSQPTLSLNPCYADMSYDWNVLNLEVDRMIGPDPYTISDTQNLATSWELSTWTSATYGTATNITFHMRHDLTWSDGVPLTASDAKFTWGGPAVTGSISNLIALNGNLPPTYWSANLLDIVSVSTPDPWTVNVLLDTYAYFGLHSMSGFNIVLPEHIWKPIFQSSNPNSATWSFQDAAPVVSGPWILEHQWDPTSHGSVLVLDKNVNYKMLFLQSSPQVPVPMIEWSNQTSNASTEVGNVHWIYPNKNQYAVQLTDTVTLHNYYVYEMEPNLTDAYPYTKIDGVKTVELYKWNRVGSPNGGTYTLVQTLETNVPVDLPRCQDVEETFGPLTLTCGWYCFKVSFNITSLAYSADGITYTPVADNLNVFWNHTKVYKEYCIVTSRYDIGGAYWQPGNLQPCPDLKVNLVDTFSASLAFGSAPGLLKWNPAADINGDNKINLQDFFAIALAFGWTDP